MAPKARPLRRATPPWVKPRPPARIARAAKKIISGAIQSPASDSKRLAPRRRPATIISHSRCRTTAFSIRYPAATSRKTSKVWGRQRVAATQKGTEAPRAAAAASPARVPAALRRFEGMVET